MQFIVFDTLSCGVYTIPVLDSWISQVLALYFLATSFFFFNIALLGTVSSSFIMELLVRVADLDAELCVTERRYEMHLRSCEKIRDYNIEKSRPRHLLGCIVPWPRHNPRVATCLVDMPSIV